MTRSGIRRETARRVLVAAALLLAAAGCYRGVREAPPGAPPKPAERVSAPAPEDGAPAAESAPLRPAGPSAASSPEPALPAPEAAQDVAPVPAEEGKAAVPAPLPGPSHAPPAPTHARTKGAPASAPEREAVAAPPHPAPGQDGEPVLDPPWVRDRETLSYEVTFLGIRVAIARFTALGKGYYRGKEVYRLNVRGWTTGILSAFFPMNEVIDYYLDARTLAPLRQEYQKSAKEDDIAFYDQEKGTIVYRYKKDGRVRKSVEAVPNVYDPVSAAYFYRSRDVTERLPPRNLYAGRKLYEVSPRVVRTETVRTAQGEVEAYVVEPLLLRDGKEDRKGDIRMWMTTDERRVPVRLYARFKKIRNWTLVAELIPDLEEG